MASRASRVFDQFHGATGTTRQTERRHSFLGRLVSETRVRFHPVRVMSYSEPRAIVAPSHFAKARFDMPFLLGAIYFVLLVTLGLLTIRKGHLVLFIVGFIFPLLWLAGALMPSRSRVR